MSYPQPPWLSAVEESLDRAQDLWLLLDGVGAFDAKHAALHATLTQVLEGLLKTYSGSQDPLLPIAAALDAMHRAKLESEALTTRELGAHCGETLTRCIEQMVTVEGILRNQAPPSPSRSEDLIASIGLPRLHTLTRPTLLPRPRPAPTNTPVVPAPDPTERPKSFEELESLAKRMAAKAKPQKPAAPKEEEPAAALPPPVPAGFVIDPLPALSLETWTQVNAADCFLDVVLMLTQRCPQLAERWEASEFLEQRLLANIDALASLDHVALAHLHELVSEFPVVDAALLSGLCLVAGSIAGRDLLAMTERLLVSLDTDQSIWQGAADAFKLVPSPLLAVMLGNWQQSLDVRKRTLAIDVLGYRSWLTPTDVEKAMRDDVALQRVALPYLHLLPREQRNYLLADLLETANPQLLAPLYIALVQNGHPAALPLLRRHFDGNATPDQLLLLALGGDHADAERLTQQFQAAPTPELARAVGWAGLGNAVPLLIAALTSDNKDLIARCADALIRMTGADLYEEVEIPAEQVMDPDIPEPDLADAPPKLSAQLSDPRDLPGEGSPDKLLLPAQSYAVWMSYWEADGAKYQPQSRYRRGQLHAPGVLVQELMHAPCTPSERAWIHLELQIRTGRRVEFNPHAWVAQQRHMLANWQATAETAPFTPGSWERNPPPN